MQTFTASYYQYCTRKTAEIKYTKLQKGEDRVLNSI